MRQLMLIVLAVLSMSFGMGEAFAKKVQFSASANQVLQRLHQSWWHLPRRGKQVRVLEEELRW